jgi:hypothetical protein
VETIIRRPNKHISSRINNSNNTPNRLRFSINNRLSSMRNRMILVSALALRFLVLLQLVLLLT